MSNKSKSLASNTAWGAVASLIATACRMATGIFLAHYFSTEMNGSYLLFGWLAEFLTLLICLGAPAVLNRFPVLENTKGNTDFANAIIQWAWKRAGISGILISIIYFIALTYWDSTKHFSTTTLTLAAVLLITQSLSTIANACLVGLQLFKNLAVNNLIAGIALVMFQCVGAYLFGIDGALFGFVLANVINITMILSKIKENIACKGSPSKYDFKEIKYFAIQTGGAALLSAVVWSRSEIFFLNQFSTSTQAAYFGVAISLVSAISLGVTMLTNAVTPHFSARMAPGVAIHRLQRDYSLITILAALFCIPTSIFASALMPVLMPFLFGTKYIDATLVAQLLVLSAGFGFANVGTSLLYASGSGKFIVQSNLIGAVLMFVGLYFTIEKYGAIGAVLIRLTTQAIIIIAGTKFNSKKLNIMFPVRALIVLTMMSVLVAVPAYYLAIVGELIYCFLYIPLAVFISIFGLKTCKLFTKHQSVRLYKIMARVTDGWLILGKLNYYLFRI